MYTQPKPFAFTLMPFSPAFEDAYRLAIKPACEAAGAYTERVDEQIFGGSILERIYNQISKSDLVIADLSERNPNVFYEVGYAHAIGKSTILLTRKAEDIPFDLKHFPHIIYGDSLATLRERLEGTVRWHLQNPEVAEQAVADVKIRLNAVRLSGNCVIELKVNKGAFEFVLEVEVENHVGRTVGQVDGRIGLLYPCDFDGVGIIGNYQTTEVALDEKTRLCLVGQRVSLLPGEWWTQEIPFSRSSRLLDAGEEVAFVIRLLRSSGVRDFPFTIRVLHK